MTVVTTHQPGAPCWIDLVTSDVPGARAFYSALLGWMFDIGGPEYGHYNVCLKAGAAVAGLVAKQSPDQPDVWTVYLATADIEATARRVGEAGGTVVVPPMRVGPRGSMMVAVDPGGGVVGAWQAGNFTGTQRVGEHGAPIWFELYSPAYDKVLPFYRQAFGWDLHTMSDTPEFRYSTLGQGDGALAGILDTSNRADLPSAWQVYFACDDVDAAARLLQKLRGTVIAPPFDTPYGRMGTFTDPTGARLCLMSHRA